MPMWSERTRWTGDRWAAWLMSITFGSLLVMADTAARLDMASAAEQPPGWGRYRDREFRMAFDFPAHIFSLKSAEQGSEGVIFSTPDDRARIRLFGFRNEANDTPRRYLRRIANPEQARFTYVRTTQRFFVASGTRDGMIFYRRCNFFRDKRVSCFQLDYPEGEKREWDSIVTRISLSLAAAERRSEPNEDSLAVNQVLGGTAQSIMCPAATTGHSAGPGARTLIPLPNRALLTAPAEFNCELKAASPDEAPGQSPPSLPPAQADADTALRAKLDYERQCYRHAEMILRDRLLLLQAQTGETIRAATKCAAASAGSSAGPRARASIPLPAQALLASPPEFQCEKTAPTRAQTDPDAALRAKLDHERQCYRHAEMIMRDRLLQLQASLGEMITAINRGEPPAVKRPMVKQEPRDRGEPPAVKRPMVKQEPRGGPKLAPSQPASAEITYPWCAQYSGGRGGGRNCGFWTYEQCSATVSGISGNDVCEVNAMYRGPQPGMIPPPSGPPRRYGY
jgi:Protein of unknown function (DUF3551)